MTTEDSAGVAIVTITPDTSGFAADLKREAQARDVVAVWAEGQGPSGRPVMGVSATNSLPWPVDPVDLAHFRESTRGRVLVMGRRTFESLPESMRSPRSTFERPLVVLTHGIPLYGINPGGYWHAGTFETPEETLRFARAVYPDKGVAVIGGPSVIESFAGLYDRGLVTTVDGYFEGDVPAPSPDVFFPGYRARTRRLGDGLLLTEYERSL